jgi:hypothetical protein
MKRLIRWLHAANHWLEIRTDRICREAEMCHMCYLVEDDGTPGR